MTVFHVLVMPMPHNSITEKLAEICEATPIIPYCWHSRLTLAIARQHDISSGLYLLKDVGSGALILKILFPECKIVALRTDPLLHADQLDTGSRILLNVNCDFVLDIAFPDVE